MSVQDVISVTDYIKRGPFAETFHFLGTVSLLMTFANNLKMIAGSVYNGAVPPLRITGKNR
jgi:hypothetical protein